MSGEQDRFSENPARSRLCRLNVRALGSLLTKNRRFQFRLSTVMVLLTIACVWLGWRVHQARVQRDAVTWVYAVGGRVISDSRKNRESPLPSWLRNVIDIHFFNITTGIECSGTEISDITPLANLTSLNRALLDQTSVSDLTPLAGLTDLTWLDLNETQISDLTPLAGLKNLAYLDIGQTLVSDLTPLVNNTSLTQLDVSETLASDLTPVASLTKLRELYLDDIPVSDVPLIGKLTNLDTLYTRTHAGEDSLKMLKRALPNCAVRHNPRAGGISDCDRCKDELRRSLAR